MKNITIKQSIKEFPTYLYLKNNTKSTATAYMGDLKIFQDFLKGAFPSLVYIKDLERHHVIQYQTMLLELVQQGTYKKTTADRKFDSIKVFFNYLEHYGHIKDNFLKSFNFNRSKQVYGVDFDTDYLPEFLEEDEVDLIISQAKKSTHKTALRDLAILEMLRSTGCRRSSILALEVGDVDFHKQQIKIKHEKTKNVSVVPLSNRLKIALYNHISTLPAPTGFVFQNKSGGQISKECFNKVIKKYVQQSGLKKDFDITSKTFRHSFITSLVRKGVKLSQIAKYTGHKDINTLRIYTHLQTVDLDDVALLIG